MAVTSIGGQKMAKINLSTPLIKGVERFTPLN